MSAPLALSAAQVFKVQHWLKEELPKVCDAAPNSNDETEDTVNPLSDYILAMLSKDVSRLDEMKTEVISNLSEFCQDETVTFVERLFRYLHGLTTGVPKQQVSGPSSQIIHRRSHSRSPVSGHSGTTLPQPTIDPNTRYQPQTVSVAAGDAGSSALTSSRDRDREAQQRREDRFGALSANESDSRRGGDIRVDKRGDRGDRGVRSGDFRDHRDQGRDMRDRERDRDFRMNDDRRARGGDREREYARVGGEQPSHRAFQNQTAAADDRQGNRQNVAPARNDIRTVDGRVVESAVPRRSFVTREVEIITDNTSSDVPPDRNISNDPARGSNITVLEEEKVNVATAEDARLFSGSNQSRNNTEYRRDFTIRGRRGGGRDFDSRRPRDNMPSSMFPPMFPQMFMNQFNGPNGMMMPPPAMMGHMFPPPPMFPMPPFGRFPVPMTQQSLVKPGDTAASHEYDPSQPSYDGTAGGVFGAQQQMLMQQMAMDMGGRVQRGYGRVPNQQQAKRTLSVSNIPVSALQQSSLLAYFKQFGRVVRITLLKSDFRAFIAFESESAALAGVQSAVVVFDDIPCPIKFAMRDMPDTPVVSAASGQASSVVTQKAFVVAARDSLENAEKQLAILYLKRDPLMSKLKEQRALLEKLCKNTKIAVAEKNSMMSRINALSAPITAQLKKLTPSVVVAEAVVKKAREKLESLQPVDPTEAKSALDLHVSNIPVQLCQEAALRSHFEKYGTITELFVSAASQTCRVQYADVSQVENASVLGGSLMGHHLQLSAPFSSPIAPVQHTAEPISVSSETHETVIDETVSDEPSARVYYNEDDEVDEDGDSWKKR